MIHRTNLFTIRTVYNPCDLSVQIISNGFDSLLYNNVMCDRSITKESAIVVRVLLLVVPRICNKYTLSCVRVYNSKLSYFRAPSFYRLSGNRYACQQANRTPLKMQVPHRSTNQNQSEFCIHRLLQLPHRLPHHTSPASHQSFCMRHSLF